MTGEIYIKNYPAPDINYREIKRYSGIFGDELDSLIEECLNEARDKCSYKVCYRILPVKIERKLVDFGEFQAESADLSKNLAGCCSAVIFAATIGVEFDRIIRKYSLLEPSKSVIFQAIGAERAESLCDVFCGEIKAEFGETAPRYSPGYGDLSLAVQRDIFRVLEPQSKIGLTLSENLLMMPSKSVTAITGIRK